jgi:DNA-binding NtrC family response regulator
LLNRSAILVVEDEPYIALELQAAIEEAGGKVVGPVGSVRAALALLQECPEVSAAVLDVQLSDREVTPVAKALSARGVPVVFQSAKSLPPDLVRQCPNAVLYKKPVAAEALLRTLLEITQQRDPPA